MLARVDFPVPIALVITDLDIGGAEKALVALATRVDRSRWSPSVVCLGPEGKLVEPLLAAGIAVECLNVSRRRPVQAVGRLARSLRKTRPKIIQSFLFHANLASKLAAPLAGGPWVIGGIRVAEREKRWHLTLDRLTQSLSSGSICVSEGVLRFSRDVGKIAPGRLSMIPNGIDPAPFDRIPPSRGHRVALFVGRIAKQKGVSLLLDAWEAVHDSRGGWTLKLAGDGPELADLRRRRVSNVEFLGRRDDVPNLMKTADLLVLPSLWEGMPNAVLEGMAAGLPILASRVEGSEDLVIAEGADRNGWLVEPGDVRSLAGAICEAVAVPEVLPIYGLRSRELVELTFSMGNVARAYERLWSRVLRLPSGE